MTDQTKAGAAVKTLHIYMHAQGTPSAERIALVFENHFARDNTRVLLKYPTGKKIWYALQFSGDATADQIEQAAELYLGAHWVRYEII